MSLESLKRGFNVANRFLNVCGYFPIVSTISGVARQSFGLTKMLFSIPMRIVTPSSSEKPNYQFPSASYFLLDGALDFGRGTIEELPIIGNVACLAYDIFK